MTIVTASRDGQTLRVCMFRTLELADAWAVFMIRAGYAVDQIVGEGETS